MNRLLAAIVFLLPLTGFSSELIFDVDIEIENTGYEIMNIGVYADTDENNHIKNIYVETPEKRFELTLAQIASGRPTLISYRGIQMATIQGLSKTTSGEGWLRITPSPKRIARNATPRSKSIDVYIFPSLIKNHWKAIYQQEGAFRWISKAKLVLNKNPFEMSWADILFSPPKIIDLSPMVANCKNEMSPFRNMFYYFGLKRGLELLGCDSKKFGADSIIAMMIALNSHPYYLNYVDDSVARFSAYDYGKKLPQKPKVRNYPEKLEEFRKLVFDFSDPANRDLVQYDYLFSRLIVTGELEAIEYLFSMGVFPKNSELLLPVALAQLYQYSLFEGQLLAPDRSRKIYDLILSTIPSGTTFDLRYLLRELNAPTNASLKVNSVENNPAFLFLVKTLEFAKSSKLFTFDPSEKYVAEELAYNLVSAWVNDSGDPYLNDVQLQELVLVLKNWNQ